SEACTGSALKKLAKQELCLRKGQANNTLQQIQITLSNKSYIFHKYVQHYKSQSKKTRTWGCISQQDDIVQKHARIYAQCRKAMVRLGVSSHTLEKYQILEKSDCRVNTGIIDDPSKRGNRNKVLPWIWGLGDGLNKGKHLTDFVRLHWLREKAMRDHWQEDLTFIINEMDWVCNYFNYHGDSWRRRAEHHSPTPGHEAYTACQCHMWYYFARTAHTQFEEAKLMHLHPILADFQVNRSTKDFQDLLNSDSEDQQSQSSSGAEDDV
ncbi:hypothetical protein JAAARDRAFT_118788, partial [Jaapia argillacea MUCL 33604]